MRSKSLKFYKTLQGLLFVIFASIAVYLYDPSFVHNNVISNLPVENIITKQPVQVSTSSIQLIGTFTVSYIVDGDTVHVIDDLGVEQIVRLLAVNTPEMNSKNLRDKCMAEMAKEYAGDKLLGKKVKLFTDSTQPKIDKYNRTLAYLQVDQASSTNYFNEDLLVKGYAKVFWAKPPAILYPDYLAKQKEAKQSNLRIWDREFCKAS